MGSGAHRKLQRRRKGSVHRHAGPTRVLSYADAVSKPTRWRSRERSGRRPAAGGEDRLGKNAKRRPDEEKVEEFFALIRRIRSTSKLVDKEKSSRSPIFQWEDFVAGNAAAEDAAADGSEKEPSAGRSSEDEDVKDGDVEEEEGEKGEGVEDNGLPGWLDLNVDLAAAKS